MHNFRELKIWQRSYSLVKKVYQLLGQMPNEEKHGLNRQIARWAVSIPSNIAEGSRRSSSRDFHRFLEISIGSSFELETQITIAGDLDFIDSSNCKKIFVELTEIQKMMNSFRMTLLKEPKVEYQSLTPNI